MKTAITLIISAVLFGAGVASASVALSPHPRFTAPVRALLHDGRFCTEDEVRAVVAPAPNTAVATNDGRNLTHLVICVSRESLHTPHSGARYAP